MLSEFFRINLPYGMKRNDDGSWYAFNREYMPLGWNTIRNKEDDFSKLPIHTKYNGLSEKKWKQLLPEESRLEYNDKGEVVTVWFYDDKTNPEITPKYWEEYFKIIKGLAGMKIQN